MERITTRTGIEPTLVRTAVRADGIGAGTFLRWGEGRPRGFWARGRGWLAHVGSVHAIEVRASDAPDGRYGLVRGRADAILRSLTPGEWTPSAGRDAPGTAEVAGPGLPRFYGGFSFREDHVARDFWAEYPSARFLLPELELEHGAAGTWLVAQATLSAGDDHEAVRMGLERQLAEVRATLAEQDGDHPRSIPQPATRLESQRGEWAAVVRDTLEAIEQGEFSKAVLARILDVSTPGGLDPVDVLSYLRRENTEAHVFLFEPVPGSPLLGAAPETIATLRGEEFHATAVAGTVQRGDTSAEESENAARLLTSRKDRIEHACTVEDMVARLRPLCRSVTAEAGPHVLTLARIQHLETRIEATVRPGTHVLELLAALHPTPAVCGFPRDAALAFLHREEPFERGWYAGPVGWFDGAGNGIFVPALRTAVARDTTWRLYAGAGIVPGSDPDLEWEETGIKLQPVLRALAAAGAQ